jgi:hypothetical protein
MLQLHPRETFVITRQLQNPYITDTFYVRAVIRNAKTDTIIDTINLDDKTSQRFTKSWLVPADGSGQGFWISIVTSVYTDSGYTTKSENYGDEEKTYLVQERFNVNLGGMGGGGGSDIDYKRIKKIVKEVIDEMETPEPVVKVVTKEVVKEVRVPEVKIVETQKEQDLSPIIKAIKDVGQKVDDKEVTEIPEQEEVDLSPVLEKIALIEKQSKENVDRIEKKIDSMKVEVKLADFTPQIKAEPVESKMVDPRITRLMRKIK